MLVNHDYNGDIEDLIMIFYILHQKKKKNQYELWNAK